MNLSEWIRFLYGITLGTSTPLIDVGSRPHRPLRKLSLDDGITALIGGVSNCVMMENAGDTLLINTNMSQSAEEILHQVPGRVTHIINQKAHPYFVGGNEFYHEARDIYCGTYNRNVLIKEFGDRKIPNQLVGEKTEMFWGSRKIILEPVTSGQFEKNLLVYLPESKTLMLGDLFYNKIFPIYKGYSKIDTKDWIALLEKTLTHFQAEQIIPGEGEIAKPADVAHFMKFLNDVSQPNAKISDLAEKYPWENIEGLSSLHECVEFFKK